MEREPDRLCAAMAEAQHGVFNMKQARAAGLSAQAITRRLASGRFVRVIPRVLRFAGTPLSWRGECMALYLSLGEGSAISGESAAALYGVEKMRKYPLEISTVHPYRCHDLDAIVHRVDERLLPLITHYDSIPVTRAERVVMDLAGRKHPRTRRVLNDLWRLGHMDIGDLWMLCEQGWMRGRRGVRFVYGLLVEVMPHIAPTDSDLEDMFVDFVQRYSFPMPVPQWPLELPSGRRRYDFAYPDRRLGIELDSLTSHTDPDPFDNDRIKDGEAQVVGWRTLRITFGMLRFREAETATLMRNNLDAPPLPLPSSP